MRKDNVGSKVLKFCFLILSSLEAPSVFEVGVCLKGISVFQAYVSRLPVCTLLAPVHILLRWCDCGQHWTATCDGNFHLA